MEHFSQAWNDVKDNLVGWIIYVVVFSVINSFTGGLGSLVLMPNFLRGTRDALKANSAPDIGALFNFDKVGDDVVAMLIWGVGIAIGSIACGIGAIVAAVLFFWIPMLAADGRFAPADVWKVSLAHTKGAIGPIFVFAIVAGLLNTAGVLACGLGVLVTAPMTLVAQWRFYEANRDEIYRLAARDGVNAIG